jgi:serine/threonine-protein kinase
MALAAGTRLGAYEITGQLGVGGMGEVYRATDTKLGREVAIKTLPSALARDTDRLARFGREAKLLAALNHTHIAAIYGLDEHEGTQFLAMELVEGGTLEEKLKDGPLAVEDALRLALQIAEALEAAHDKGVVHRDLKPANVMVTRDGVVKVLDFGLAKALEMGAGATNPADSPAISQLATKAGALLGTAAYMSPEQAKGRQVDRRTDIWAFGCLLYEMLTGQPAFLGEVVTDTLAAVIRAEPDWALLPAATHRQVRILLRRCLHKDARQRLQAMGDARIAIEEVLSGTEPSGEDLQRIHNGKLWLAWSVAGAAIVAAIAALVLWSPWPSGTQSHAVTRFTINLPPGQRLAGLSNPALAFSADGGQLAYVATTQDGVQQIYLRAMEGIEARPLSGTEGATSPFFSPDGQWLGFLANGKLQKISGKGGVAQTLTTDLGAGLTSGASWVGEHMIAFAAYQSALQGISDSGGTPEPLTRFEPGESYHMWPQPLPGGKAMLFTAFSASPTAIAVQPISEGERRDLIEGQTGHMPSYVPSGHLIYAQAGNLMAVPLDLEGLAVKGVAVPVLQGVLQSQRLGTAQYSVSGTGSLAYVSGTPQAAGESTLVWVSRDGTEQVLGAPARTYNQPRLSPDGRRIAVDVIAGPQAMQVWLYDVARDTLTPFTFEGLNRHATWTLDGKRIVFMSNREGVTQLYWQLVDGSGGSERLTNNAPIATADVLDVPYSWSRDGELLTFVKVDPTKGAEFWMLDVATPSASPEQRHVAQRLPLEVSSPDGGPQFSPDGRWLAYASDDESGQRQVYVQPYPGPGGKWQISTDGGNEPLWNPNGRELFYRRGDEMMVVDISAEAGITAGKPQSLFAGRYAKTLPGWVRPNYDVSPDGQQFLMLKLTEQEEAPLTQINIVLNWSEELKRLVPTE